MRTVYSNTNKKIRELQYVNTLQKAKNFSTNTVSYYLNYVDIILGWFATQSSQEQDEKLS